MNDNQEKTITLYPSNWLYNAGVVGFLRVLEFGDKNRLNEILKRDFLSITETDVDIVNKAYWSFGIIHILSKDNVIKNFLLEHWNKFKNKSNTQLPSKIEMALEQCKKDFTFEKLDALFRIKEVSLFQEDNLATLKEELKSFYFKIIENILKKTTEKDNSIKKTKRKTKDNEELIKFKEHLEKELSQSDLKSLLRTTLKNKLGSKDSILAGHPIFNPGVEISNSEKKLNCFIEKRVKESIKNANNIKSFIHCKICGIPIKYFNYDLSWDFFSRIYSTFMGTSYEEVKNFFFNYQHDILICSLCQLLLILSPFGLPPDQREFVNVASIKALYYLNNLLLKLKKTETYKALTPNQRLESLISEAILNYEFLKGAWLLQNVEFIQIEKGTQPKVYTLPISKTSAELIIRGDIRTSLAKLKGQITIVKKEKNPTKIYAQREGIKRFLTGGTGSLVDLSYFAFKNDFIENIENTFPKGVALNLAKLEKVRIDYKKERRFEMVENDLIEIWNKGQELKKLKTDKNLQYELLSAALIEDKNRLFEYLSEIERKNKLQGNLTFLCEFIKSKEGLNIREIILAFIAGYKSEKSLSYEDILENPLKIFWNEGKEIGEKIEKDIESRIKKYVFRAISKTRVGDRNGTIFEILKLYLLSERHIPIYLSEMFADKTDSEKFKLYAYSFLAGFIGKNQKEEPDLMYEMQKIGEDIIDDEFLEDRIKKYGFRLLSLIRAGQKAEFAYEIIKLYAQARTEIPYKFIEILDPDKSIAEFQCLSYGILSGYLEK